MVKIEIIPESLQLLRMSDEEYFSKKYKDYISNTRLGMANPEEGGSLEKFLAGFDEGYNPSFELGSALHAMVLQPDSYYISKFRKPGGKLGIFVEKLFKIRKDPKITIINAVLQASKEADYYSGSLSATRLKNALKIGLPYYLYLRWNEHLEILEESFLIDKVPIYLSESEHNKYINCITNLIKNKEAIILLEEGDFATGKDNFNEYAILCEMDVTIDNNKVRLKFKGKFDNFTVDSIIKIIILNDLKTSSKPASFFMGNNVRMKEGTKDKWVWYDGSFQKYHYYRQMALYIWLLQCYFQKEFSDKCTFKANIIVVETVPDFGNKIYPITNNYIRKGLKEAKNLLTLIAEWKLSGKI